MKKIESKYWNDRTHKLFDIDPKYKLVRHRQEAIKLLLQEQFPQIKELASAEEIIHKITMLERLLRRETENEEVEVKKILAQEWKIENNYLN